MKKNDLSPEAFRFEGKMSLKQALPLGMQHVLAMFVGNLTPLLIITGACGLAGGEFADLRVTLLQNAMLVAGIVTLVQLYSIGPIGGKVPIIMGTSSGFIGVFSSVAASMGGGVLAYGAIMGASLIGGLFETVLGFFLKPLRKLLPSVVTGTVVLSIGLSLISVGVNSFGGGNTAQDFGSVENLLLAIFVLVVILICKHSGSTFLNSSSILVGIICGYIAAFLMGLVLPTTALNAEGVAYTKAWVLNWNKVAEASWFAIPKLVPVKIVFDLRAILPVMIMFIVTAVRGIGRWHKNNNSPRLTVDATIVSKRMDVTHHHNSTTRTNSSSTWYYATFQVASGDRMELSIPTQDYGYLVEGDHGKLTFQGTRYLSFERA